MGIAKAYINGTVNNATSNQKVNFPAEFLVRCAEGVSANEYQLLRMNQKKDRREFHTVTYGYASARGGADENAVAVKFDKVTSRVYRVKLDQLRAGEYGWLPPGTALSSSATSVGKIYTFHVSE